MIVLDNPFWRFSTTVYAEPGVAQECIALQDSVGADVNILLFSAWLGGATRSTMTDDQLIEIESNTQEWRGRVIEPLRSVRRTLKNLSHADKAIQDLRMAVGQSELLAEQIEQAQLFSSIEPASNASNMTVEQAVRHNVTAFLKQRYRAIGTSPGATRKGEILIDAAVAYHLRSSQTD
jgi:uncharacterized protein (TIGR02444 family)